MKSKEDWIDFKRENAVYLKLLSIKCSKQEDQTGKDLISLKAGGISYELGEFGAGTDPKDLNYINKIPFIDFIEIELWEIDADSPNDSLGHFVVGASTANQGVQQQILEKKHWYGFNWKYTIKYEVTKP